MNRLQVGQLAKVVGETPLRVGKVLSFLPDGYVQLNFGTYKHPDYAQYPPDELEPASGLEGLFE